LPASHRGKGEGRREKGEGRREKREERVSVDDSALKRALTRDGLWDE